jgi:hypothetical protein
MPLAWWRLRLTTVSGDRIFSSRHRLFTNGQEGLFDCSHLLDFGVFRELRDPEYFRKVTVANGTVAWPHEQDICPDTLFEEAAREN